MSKGKLIGLCIALAAKGALVTPAFGAGSEVARHAFLAVDRSAAEQRYGIGIPAPRARAFVKAPWTEAHHRASY